MDMFDRDYKSALDSLFFGEALSSIFLANSFTREAIEERIRFLL
jgi:hypothetical protein